MLELADKFEKQVGQVANSVVDATRFLETNSGRLRDAAERSNQQISNVSSASEQSSAGADTIASAVSELNAAGRVHSGGFQPSFHS